MELDWSALSTGVLGVIGDAFPLILSVMAVIIGITVGVKLFKRYAK